MHTAVILSGGTGSRVKSENMPKQYVLVCGKPVIAYVLDTVMRCSGISRCVVVAHDKWRDLIFSQFKEIAAAAGRGDMELVFADPGRTRQLSILNGLKMIEKDMGDDDLVSIIDAVRPNMTRELLESCMSSASRCDGAVPVLPVKDTVYLSEDGSRISGLLDRDQVYAGQAPEVFKFKKYLEANMSLCPEKILDIKGSTEPGVLAGMDIAMIGGDERNYKLTTDEDMDRFRDECELKRGM